MNRFFRLLAFGYFPKEIPPVLWTGEFARAVGRSHGSLATILPKTWSKPSTYLLQQRARYRRPLSIPNPNAFFWVAHQIAGQYALVKAHLLKSSFSLSSPRFNRKTKYFRAVGPNSSGDDLRLRKLQLRSLFPYVVKFDIKNFYRSIYTHSIEWAVVGKAVAKSNLRNKGARNFGKDLDEAIRIGQDGQTIGIPVGPDTSFVIGEMLLDAVDKRLDLDAMRALRFYDDYEIGASSEGEGEELLQRAESLFAEYELEVNPAKSHVITSVEDLDATWRLHIKLATKEKPKRAEEIVDLFSLACSLARENEDAFVLGYFLRRMRMFVLPKALWEVWQRILMATAFAESGALRTVYEQFDLYEKIGYRIDKNRLGDVLRKKAKHELRGAISSELSWVIFGFLKFGLSIDAAMFEEVLDRGDDISRILAIKIAVAKRVPIKKNIGELLKRLGPADPQSEHWLLFWELYRNGWASKSGLKSALTSEPIFSFLDNEGVSFVRDPGIDLLEIPSAFEEAIKKAHGANETVRLQDEIKKTFADTSQEAQEAAEVTEDEEEKSEQLEY